jgi:hypothetical protein
MFSFVVASFYTFRKISATALVQFFVDENKRHAQQEMLKSQNFHSLL